MVQYNFVRVFSATKARDRMALGDRLTEWLRRQPAGTEIINVVVRQSSDQEFHCLSIILFGWSSTGITTN